MLITLENDAVFYTVFLSALAGGVITRKILHRRARGKANPIARAWDALKAETVVFSIVFVVLLLSLPGWPALTTFGYPDSVEEVETPAKVLAYLQDYNRAIGRTVQVLFWFMLFLVGWIGSAFYGFAKAIAPVLQRLTVEPHRTTS